MDTEKQRNVGLLQLVTGMGVVVLAVLLFGIRKGDGTTDWVSVITAVAGAGMAFTGLYTLLHSRGGRPAGHTK